MRFEGGFQHLKSVISSIRRLEMATTPKAVRTRYHALEKELSAQRDALVARFTEQRSEVFVEYEPDDECAEANRI